MGIYTDDGGQVWFWSVGAPKDGGEFDFPEKLSIDCLE